MQKLRKVYSLVFIVSLFLMTAYGSALALNATDHVSVAPNGKGDVLIYPAYFTGGGWQTKLTVINTSTTLSVVAKVVIRSKENSQEIRDFMIFLSPADVWTGILSINAADGLPHITSTDDSCLAADNVFASPALPFDVFLEETCPGDTNTIGYVVVQEGAAFDLGAPVLKPVILTAYRSWISGTPPVSIRNPINSLVGSMEITNSINGQAYALNAKALKNHQWNIANGLDIVSETFLGDPGADNNLLEVEAALSTNNHATPFYAGAGGFVFATVTFPTKLTDSTNCIITGPQGPYFRQYTPSPVFSLQGWDLSENTTEVPREFISPQPPGVRSTFPSELNTVGVDAVPAGFTEGWMLVNIQGGPTVGTARDGFTGISYTGVPAIGTYMRFNAAGQAGWLYTAHDLGVVSVNGATDLQYNYFGQTDN
jgi:hypothetical protein